ALRARAARSTTSGRRTRRRSCGPMRPARPSSSRASSNGTSCSSAAPGGLRASSRRREARRRHRTLWQAEIDSAALHPAMADNEANEGVARVYRELAAMEDKHAAFWVAQLTFSLGKLLGVALS